MELDTQGVAKLVRPDSVAIIGISGRPESLSRGFLRGLKDAHFKGEIHLVGRTSDAIDGLPVFGDVGMLPTGIDLAVIALPAAGVREAIVSCVERQVGTAMVIAAGFSEAGANDAQDEIAAIARTGGLAICGPNCIGFSNNILGLTVHMRYDRVIGDTRQLEPGEVGIAFAGQSGGVLGHVQRATSKRRMPVSYFISTGNEAGLDIADYLQFLVDDASTKVIALYAEQIRRPGAFLKACSNAKAAGKPVVVLHPGRSSRARAAAKSHTGAMVGDHSAMITCVRAAGAVVVGTMDELMDVGELLLRYPVPPTRGPAVITGSGAFVALANDFADELGLDFPALAPATIEALKANLPFYGVAGNPLDTTAGLPPGVIARMTRALADDPNTGSLLISYPAHHVVPMNEFIAGTAGVDKPVVLALLGDGAPLPPDVEELSRTARFLVGESSDRALRALAHFTALGKRPARTEAASPLPPLRGVPSLSSGPQPEWIGKQVLAAAGIATPQGGLAHDASEAAQIAGRIGYPVALKAQAFTLTHKTEAGGVILDVKDEADLQNGWLRLHDNIKRSNPELVLDGVLIERMAQRGLELMVGGKRDPAWGPVLLVGIGGIWVEAIGDVRVMPPDITHAEVIVELMKLRSAALLKGFRGAPPVDVDAVADVVVRIGQLMQELPSVSEIDVNPLVGYAAGQGAGALDALVVVEC